MLTEDGGNLNTAKGIVFIIIGNKVSRSMSAAGLDDLCCAVTSVTKTAYGGMSYSWMNSLGRIA
jgi:hypothetical protein